MPSKSSSQQQNTPKGAHSTGHETAKPDFINATSDVILRAYRNLSRLMPADVQALQPILGNHALGRLLDAQSVQRQPSQLPSDLTVGPSKDRFEENANRVAKQVIDGDRDSLPTVSVQHRPNNKVIQRFFVTDPQSGELGVDSTGNQLTKNKAARQVNYERTPRKNVGLRISDDSQMAVPDTYQTKDFYASERVTKHTSDMMEARESGVVLEETADRLAVPNRHESLIRLEPRGRGEGSKVAALGNAFAFIDTCIDMAHFVTTGQYAQEGGNALLNQGKQKIIYKSPLNRRAEFKENFPEEKADLLGINQYAMPEVGDMLATLNLLHRENMNDFEYHFAGVVAKSGADYVTLENYNRDGEDAPMMKEFLDDLVNVEGKFKDLYTQSVQINELSYTKGTKGDEKKAEIARNKPRIMAKAEKDFWAAIEDAKLKEAMVTTNIKETKNALWYFQMYGPPNKKVLVDAVKKVKDGMPKTEKRVIDQSFHGHMQATDDFGETLTLRIEGNTSDATIPPETTTGVDPRAQGIVEPPLEESSMSNFWGATSYTSIEGIKAGLLKGTLKDIVQNGAPDHFKLDNLENELTLLGDGENQKEAHYMLKMLRLEASIKAKQKELHGRLHSYVQINPARMKELAQISPRWGPSIQKLIQSKVADNFAKDLKTYEGILDNVSNHKQFKNLIPIGYYTRLNKTLTKMQDELKFLAATVDILRKRLL